MSDKYEVKELSVRALADAAGEPMTCTFCGAEMTCVGVMSGGDEQHPYYRCDNPNCKGEAPPTFDAVVSDLTSAGTWCEDVQSAIDDALDELKAQKERAEKWKYFTHYLLKEYIDEDEHQPAQCAMNYPDTAPDGCDCGLADLLEEIRALQKQEEDGGSEEPTEEEG